MCNRFLFGILLALTAPVAVAKTALDLMLEGRFGEAKAILDTSNVSPRYQLLYFAMVESDAARACSLYQVIAVRYPNSDCDSVARLRLDQAQEAGFVLVPIAEWAQAAPGARPLVLRREQPRVNETEVPVLEAAPPPPPPVPVAAPIVTVPVSVVAPPPPAAEEEAQISVRDTLIVAEKPPEVVKPAVVDIVVPPPPPPTREVVSTPVEAAEGPVVRETAVPPAPSTEQAPIAEPPPVSPPPVAPAVEKVTPPPVVEAKETAAESPPARLRSIVPLQTVLGIFKSAPLPISTMRTGWLFPCRRRAIRSSWCRATAPKASSFKCAWAGLPPATNSSRLPSSSKRSSGFRPFSSRSEPPSFMPFC